MDATALSACLLAAGLACGAGAAEPTVAAQSQIKDRKGDVVGTAELLQTAGGLLIKVAVKTLQPGQHAIHIHTVGKCEPPFTTAGPHFNPEQHPHGMLAGDTQAGDLPNLHVPDGGDYALGNHVAALGLTFYNGDLLPANYRGGAFIGQHGSWNRRPPSGYKVVFVPFADGRPSGMPIDILSGFLNSSGEALGRPVGVAVDRAGALLVADDVGNTVWRITPAAEQASPGKQ